MRWGLGPLWRRALVSASKRVRSITVAFMPFRARAMAVVSPPIPPPTMSVRRCATRVVMRGCSGLRRAGRRGRHEHASRRIAFRSFHRRIVVEKRRAIWAYEIGAIAHIDVHGVMIERRLQDQGVEFLDADLDAVDALVVHEMRHKRLSHSSVNLCCKGLDRA